MIYIFLDLWFPVKSPHNEWLLLESWKALHYSGKVA